MRNYRICFELNNDFHYHMQTHLPIRFRFKVDSTRNIRFILFLCFSCVSEPDVWYWCSVHTCGCVSMSTVRTFVKLRVTIPVNFMINSRSRGPYRCYRTVPMTMEWLQYSGTYMWPSVQWLVTLAWPCLCWKQQEVLSIELIGIVGAEGNIIILQIYR